MIPVGWLSVILSLFRMSSGCDADSPELVAPWARCLAESTYDSKMISLNLLQDIHI